MAKKFKKKRRGKSFDPLNNLGTKIRKKEGKIKKNQIEEWKPKKRNKNKGSMKNKNTLLDNYMLNILKTLGHPDKVIIQEIEENVAMKQIIKEEIEEFRSNAMYDEDGNKIFDQGLAAMMELFRKYSVEIRQGVKEIKDSYQDLKESEVDEELLNAYKSMTFFIQFLESTEPEERTIENFMDWRTQLEIGIAS